MRHLISLFCILIFIATANAQDFKLLSNSAVAKASIEKKHKSTTTLMADFNEVVESTMFKNPQSSKGKLHYKSSDKIRWENTDSKQLILLNGSKVKMRENGKEVSNAMTNKIVKKIQSMMLSMLSGDFLSEKEFKISYYESSSQYKLILTPKNPRMAKYIQKIDLYFNKKSALLDSMTMHESNEQKVTYTFFNTVVNSTISDSKFNQY